jgi:light-regulated signal transduction histidine kinase (bacteriophytochrome)
VSLRWNWPPSYAIERERAEQQILKFNAELEQRVDARTAELEASNKELETFSYSVSHDLRAPLRYIDGFSKLLLETYGSQLGDEGNDYIRRIDVAVQRMSAIIEDLLKLAQIGRQHLSRKSTDLNSLVESVLVNLKSEMNGRTIEWRVGGLPQVECDVRLIEQVFVNLLENSIKYTRRWEVAIFEVGQTAIAGQKAIFVRDNGAGFDMEYSDGLFVPFKRRHTQSEFEGTGVGLATEQRIVQRHGGRI